MTRLEAAAFMAVAVLILVLGLWLGLTAIWSKRKIPPRAEAPREVFGLPVEADERIPENVIVLKARRVGYTQAALRDVEPAFDFPPLSERPYTPRFYNQEARPWRD